MVMYDRRFQPTMIIVVVFHLRWLLLNAAAARYCAGLCVVIIFCFGCCCLENSIQLCPIRFSLYTRCLSLYFAHKKNKIRFFSPFLLFFFLLFCQKLFHLVVCVRAGYLFIRCLRIGSTQTAPFHLMLSLTWNENIFHHPRFCHVLVAVCEFCAWNEIQIFSHFPPEWNNFFFVISIFEIGFYSVLFSRHIFKITDISREWENDAGDVRGTDSLSTECHTHKHTHQNQTHKTCIMSEMNEAFIIFHNQQGLRYAR